MYSFPNLEPVSCSMSSYNCCFLTCVQIFQEADKVVWYSHLLIRIFHSLLWSIQSNDLPLSISQGRCFFLKPSCFFYDPVDLGNLISGSSAFSKSSLNIWKFMIHILLKPCLENFEHYFANLWDEGNCEVAWTFFGIALPLDWNENWPFPLLWPLLNFPNFLAYWMQHFHSIFFFFLNHYAQA